VPFSQTRTTCGLFMFICPWRIIYVDRLKLKASWSYGCNYVHQEESPRAQYSNVLNTSTSFTEKSGECDKHPLLKVSELELEPVKLQREMQKIQVSCAEINNDLCTSRRWCEILQVWIKIKCKMTSSPQSHIVGGAHRKIVICACSKFFTFR